MTEDPKAHDEVEGLEDAADYPSKEPSEGFVPAEDEDAMLSWWLEKEAAWKATHNVSEEATA